MIGTMTLDIHKSNTDSNSIIYINTSIKGVGIILSADAQSSSVQKVQICNHVGSDCIFPWYSANFERMMLLLFPTRDAQINSLRTFRCSHKRVQALQNISL